VEPPRGRLGDSNPGPPHNKRARLKRWLAEALMELADYADGMRRPPTRHW